MLRGTISQRVGTGLTILSDEFTLVGDLIVTARGAVMAKKKKAKATIQQDLEGLEAGLFALGNLEKDLNLVRLHLRKFLTRAQKLESGDPYEFAGKLVPRRRKRRA